MNLLQRRVTPPRNGSCALAGISVLVTGLTNDSDVRKRCSTLVQQLGGTLLADLPATDEVRSNSHPYSNHLLDPCLYPQLTIGTDADPASPNVHPTYKPVAYKSNSRRAGS